MVRIAIRALMLKRTYDRIAKTLIAIAVTLTIALLVFVLFIGTWTVANQISQPTTINALKTRLNGSYNYTELLTWEYQHLNFTYNSFERTTDPLKILDSGEGRCGEFAIVYAALCKSQGYDCRIVVNIFGDHEWTQVRVNNQWIHVDPSLGVNDSRTMDPYIYERDWKSAPILALAFDNDSITDVTSTYHNGFWINLFSIEGFSWGTVISLIAVVILTHLWVREFFYDLYFGQRHQLIKAIGWLYKEILKVIYIIRFVLIFFLPLAIGVIISPMFSLTVNQDFFMNTLVMGLVLVTFFVVEFPALTQPHVYISVIEDCNASSRKQDITINKKKCKFQDGISCKAMESEAFFVRGEPKVILLRLQNLGLHTLKNCVVWVTFPRAFYISDTERSVDFFKSYEIQKRNNAVKVSPIENYLSVSPSDCIVIPIKVTLTEIPMKKDGLQIQVSSESTWGTSYFDFPIRFIN
jgi:hypothetical protein